MMRCLLEEKAVAQLSELSTYPIAPPLTPPESSEAFVATPRSSQSQASAPHRIGSAPVLEIQPASSERIKQKNPSGSSSSIPGRSGVHSPSPQESRKLTATSRAASAHSAVASQQSQLIENQLQSDSPFSDTLPAEPTRKQFGPPHPLDRFLGGGGSKPLKRRLLLARLQSAGAETLRRTREIPAWGYALGRETFFHITGDKVKCRSTKNECQKLERKYARFIINPHIEKKFDVNKGRYISEFKFDREIFIGEGQEKSDPIIECLSISEILTWDHKGESEVLAKNSVESDLPVKNRLEYINPRTKKEHKAILVNAVFERKFCDKVPTDDGNYNESIVQAGTKVVFTILPPDQIQANVGDNGLVNLKKLSDQKEHYQRTKKLFSPRTNWGRIKTWLVHPTDLGRIDLKAETSHARQGETVGHIATAGAGAALAGTNASVSAITATRAVTSASTTTASTLQKFKSPSDRPATIKTMEKGEPGSLSYRQSVAENLNPRLSTAATIVTAVPSAALTAAGIATGFISLRVAGIAGSAFVSASRAQTSFDQHKEVRFKSLQKDLKERSSHERKLVDAQEALPNNPRIDIDEKVKEEAKAFDALASKLRPRTTEDPENLENANPALPRLLDAFIYYSLNRLEDERSRGVSADALERQRRSLLSSLPITENGNADDDDLDGLRNCDIGEILLSVFKRSIDEVGIIADNDTRKTTLALSKVRDENPTTGKLSKGWHFAINALFEKRLKQIGPQEIIPRKQEVNEDEAAWLAPLRSELIGALVQHPDFIGGLDRAFKARHATLAPTFQAPFFHESNIDLFERITHTESAIRDRILPWQPRYGAYCYDIIRENFLNSRLIAEDASPKARVLAGTEAHQIISYIAAELKKARGYPTLDFAAKVAKKLEAYRVAHFDGGKDGLKSEQTKLDFLNDKQQPTEKMRCLLGLNKTLFSEVRLRDNPLFNVKRPLDRPEGSTPDDANTLEAVASIGSRVLDTELADAPRLTPQKQQSGPLESDSGGRLDRQKVTHEIERQRSSSSLGSVNAPLPPDALPAALATPAGPSSSLQQANIAKASAS